MKRLIAYCVKCGKAGLRTFDERGQVIALPADPYRFCPRCKKEVEVTFRASPKLKDYTE